MVRKLTVELVKCRFAQRRVALDQERREGTLAQFPLQPIFIGNHAEFHIHVCKLREGFAVPADCRGPERQQSFLALAQRVRL